MPEAQDIAKDIFFRMISSLRTSQEWEAEITKAILEAEKRGYDKGREEGFEAGQKNMIEAGYHQ